MIHRPRAEFRKEDLDPQTLEVLNDEGPDVEDVVPGEGLPLLQHDGLAAHQLALDRGADAARPATHDQGLK